MGKDDAIIKAVRYQESLVEDVEFHYDAVREQGISAEKVEDIRSTINEHSDLSTIARTAVDQAIARGDFDNLKYAGKPIPGLGGTYDPDWWLKSLIERENISGMGPPAIALRHEDKVLEQTLDALYTERMVRDHLEDFNARIIEIRRQLLGGPPVTTSLRDVEAEIAAWHERRAQRRRTSDEKSLETTKGPSRRRSRLKRLAYWLTKKTS